MDTKEDFIKRFASTIKVQPEFDRYQDIQSYGMNKLFYEIKSKLPDFKSEREVLFYRATKIDYNRYVI